MVRRTIHQTKKSLLWISKQGRIISKALIAAALSVEAVPAFQKHIHAQPKYLLWAALACLVFTFIGELWKPTEK